MPTIPGQPESQVMNAGSPVPISGTGDARLQGEAIAGLGRGAFAFGDALDTAARAVKDRQKKLDSDTLYSTFLLENAQSVAETKHRAAGDSPFDNVRAYTDTSKESMQKIADMTNDPAIRQEFMAKATKHVAEQYVPVYSGEVVKYDELASVKGTNLVNLKKSLAEQDPTTIDESIVSLGETFSSIDSRKDKVIEAAQKGSKQIVEAGIHGALVRKDYKAAEFLSNKYATIFSADEKQKADDNIQSTFWKNTSQKHTVDDWTAQEAKARKEKESEDFSLKTLALVAEAPSEGERRIILDSQISGGVAAGKLNKNDAEFITKIAQKHITTRDDNTLTLQLFDDLDTGNLTLAQAKHKVVQMSIGDDASMSAEKGESLWKFFKLAEERQKSRQNPLYMKKVNEAINYIKTYGKPQGVAEKALQGIFSNEVEQQKTQDSLMNFINSEIRDPGKVEAHRDMSLNRVWGEDKKEPTINGVDYSPQDSDAVIKDKVIQAYEGKSAKVKKAMQDSTDKLMQYRKDQRDKNQKLQESNANRKEGIKEYE